MFCAHCSAGGRRGARRGLRFPRLRIIRKNLEGCENPRLHGKGLTANRSGEWRYRVGDYRLIADIQDRDVVILMLHIGHRREIHS